jgi:hypothetical protein
MSTSSSLSSHVLNPVASFKIDLSLAAPGITFLLFHVKQVRYKLYADTADVAGLLRYTDFETGHV